MVLFAIGLAAVNQVFSLMDPQIMRIIVDSHPRQWRSIAQPEEIHARVRRAIEHAIDHQMPEP